MTVVNDNPVLPSFIIRPPFPPTLSAAEFVNRAVLRNNSRGPNAFFLYRAEFTKNLVNLNYRFPMIQVSKMAAIHWSSEARRVKRAYEQIARDIDRGLDQRRQRHSNQKLVYATIITPANAPSLIEPDREPKKSSKTVTPIHPQLPLFVRSDPTLAPAGPIDSNFSFVATSAEITAEEPSHVLRRRLDEDWYRYNNLLIPSEFPNDEDDKILKEFEDWFTKL